MPLDDLSRSPYHPPSLPPTSFPYNCWSLANRHSVSNHTTTGVGSVALPSLLLTTKMTVQITSCTLVRIDVLVDVLMADTYTLLSPEPSGDLFWAPILTSQRLDLLPYGTAETRAYLGHPACQCHPMCLLPGPLSPKPGNSWDGSQRYDLKKGLNAPLIGTWKTGSGRRRSGFE